MLFLFRTVRSVASVSLAKLLAAVAELLVGSIIFIHPLAQAQNAAPGPNSDPTYQALRNLTLSGEGVAVNNFVLKRDAGTFQLHSGTLCFVAPVQGKVTGAVFVGNGTFLLDPPSEGERKNLALLTKENEFSESFEHLVLRFTDSTYDEIKRAGGSPSGNCDAGLLKDSQHALRHGHELRYNLDARILADVLSSTPGGLFVAFVHGKHYNGKELFIIDPHGAPEVVPEEVELVTYDENKFGIWTAFHSAAPGGFQRRVLRIEHQQIDATIEKSANFGAKTTTTFVSQASGLRAIPFDLFPSLRVQSVTAEGSQALSFIQEDKHDDADFWVILPRPLAEGEKFTITSTYGGKEAITNEGGGNYFPVARENWYPNTAFGEYVTYDMTFHIPKGMTMAATGMKVSETTDGGQNVTVWKSEAPQTVAGFNFGRFKMEEGKLEKPEYSVQSFANQESPDWVNSLQHAANGDLPMQGSPQPEVALGMMSTVGLNKKALAEGELAVQVYSDYFGPSSFKHLQVTQQTACNFGQSWPELVWIPICYYFDTTVRHELKMDWGDRGYWKVVTPHEVAHQWWGHTVGFSSYRDQWMSEGFSDMSASLYLTLIEKNPHKFITFWNDERELVLERNKEGFRAIDVGPVTMGYRMSNSRTGFDVYRRLVYPKGAYILHMLRMMMHENATGDQRFKDMMRDFVKTYTNKSASTEDFKAVVEKHMTAEMDLEGNHKMDWFFNEYVYGTQLPSYKMDSSFDIGADGDVVLNLKVTQSNVDEKFRMLVPIYLELADGNMFPLGRARLTGNKSIEQKIPLKGLKTKPRRAVINYYDDVLASPN